MCHKIGFPPISTIGFGLTSVSSDNLVPKPPANITTFILFVFEIEAEIEGEGEGEGEGEVEVEDEIEVETILINNKPYS